MAITSIEYTSLLLEQAQIGTMHSSQRELLVEELIMRGINSEPKEQITKLKQKLIDNKHPNITNINIKRYFLPRLLTATYWHKDYLDKMLVKITDM